MREKDKNYKHTVATKTSNEQGKMMFTVDKFQLLKYRMSEKLQMSTGHKMQTNHLTECKVQAKKTQE